MEIQIGFDIKFNFIGHTPMVLMLNVHPSRSHDLLTPDVIRTNPTRSITPYLDSFGNKCLRVLAPAGEFNVFNSAIISDNGLPDRVDLGAEEHAVSDLPPEALMHLLASRYCESDLLMDTAWALFGNVPSGWRRVQAICDFVHGHIASLQTGHDLLELTLQVLERTLLAHGRTSSTRAPSEPDASWMSTRSPAATSAAARSAFEPVRTIA